MTPALSFEITGMPIGKARPRVTRHGTYTPKVTRLYEQHVRLSGGSAMARAKLRPFTGPVGAHFKFVFTVPKSWPKWRREAARWAVGRTDLDNYVKAVADALNGICYADDRQIVSLIASKRYGSCPHTLVQLWSMGE